MGSVKEGFGNGTFRGDKEINRLELALILSNFLDKTGVVKDGDFSSSFSDIPNNHWAYKSISKLASEDIMSGYGDGTFRGNKFMNRFEFATVISTINNKYFKK